MGEEYKHPIEGVMETTMQNIKDMADANTVIGTPIKLDDGTTIIPVSKVAYGFASGGSDFGGKDNSKQNFGGGGGAGVTITPVSFLVISADGKPSLIPIDQQSGALDKAIDAMPDIVDKIKNIVKKPKEKSETTRNTKTTVTSQSGKNTENTVIKTKTKTK